MKKLCLLLICTVILPVVVEASSPDTLTIVTKSSQWSSILPNGGRLECNMNVAVPVNCAMVENPFANWLAQAAGEVMDLREAKGEWLLTALEGVFVKEGLTLKAAKDGKSFSMALDMDVKRVFEGEKLITFRANVVHYDADGTRKEAVKECSFLKQQSGSLNWSNIVKAKRNQKFNKAVVQALQGYFGVRDFDNLKLKLVNGNTINLDNFPLPKNGPAFESAGVRLNYNAGEICDALLGRPTALIPYSGLSGLLSPLAVKLLK